MNETTLDLLRIVGGVIFGYIIAIIQFKVFEKEIRENMLRKQSNQEGKDD